MLLVELQEIDGRRGCASWRRGPAGGGAPGRFAWNQTAAA